MPAGRGLIMNASHYANQSDPTLNPQFRRRWTEPPVVFRSTKVPKPRDPFDVLREAFRKIDHEVS